MRPVSMSPSKRASSKVSQINFPGLEMDMLSSGINSNNNQNPNMEPFITNLHKEPNCCDKFLICLGLKKKPKYYYTWIKI